MPSRLFLIVSIAINLVMVTQHVFFFMQKNIDSVATAKIDTSLITPPHTGSPQQLRPNQRPGTDAVVATTHDQERPETPQPQAQRDAPKKEARKQAQISHATYMNRYPQEYQAVAEYINNNEPSNTMMKILSFGSSTGEEAVSLATLYLNSPKFQNLTIYGVDLDQASLESAKQKVIELTDTIPDIEFFNGNDKNIDSYGPYDAIFANSVLCIHPFSIKKALTNFNFHDFESILETLDASLKEGGLLAIVNTNYYLEDTELASSYMPVAKCRENFVPRINQTTNAVFHMKQSELMDCVWVRMGEEGSK